MTTSGEEGLLYWQNPSGMYFVYGVEGMQPGYCQLIRNSDTVTVRVRGLFEWKYLNKPIKEAFPELSGLSLMFLEFGSRGGCDIA